MYTVYIFYLISSSHSIHRQRPSKRDFVTGLENSDIIKSKEDEKIEQVTPAHSLSPSHNIVGITTEPPRVPKRVVALKRTLSTESSTTTSSQVSTNFSINEEGKNERREYALLTG